MVFHIRHRGHEGINIIQVRSFPRTFQYSLILYFCRWTLAQDLSAPEHFQAAITGALVDLPSLTDLHLGFSRAPNPSTLDSRWTVPCRPNLTMISASIRHLTKLHFRLHPHLYPDVWVELLSLHVQLTDISVDSFSGTLLQYLGSYTGLKSLSLEDSRPTSLIPQTVARGLFDALGNHKDTLSVLLLPHFGGLPLPWWTLQANAATLVNFTHLRHLSLSVIIRNLSQAESDVVSSSLYNDLMIPNHSTDP
jgi:hypothetical protein